ncbi:MAG: hypothetical protein JO036_21315 [Candidatus Eremiobacteraeota bacterium]|nr:hypothetical protein [Candidatus Eremiobacteraeota bacterium]
MIFVAAETSEPIRWRYHIRVFGLVALGVLLVVLANFRFPEPELKDIELSLGWLLIGASVLSFDEHFRARLERRRANELRAKEREQHDQERAEDGQRHDALRANNEQLLATNKLMKQAIDEMAKRTTLLSEADASSAFYLGYSATALSYDARLPRQSVEMLITDLGIRLSERGQQVLLSDESEPNVVSATVLAETPSLLRPSLRVFFRLGNAVGVIRDEIMVSGSYSIRQSVGVLEFLAGTSLLRLDERYARLADDLIGVLGPYLDGVPDAAKDTIRAQVEAVFRRIPRLDLQGDVVGIPLRRGPWFYVSDDGKLVLMCQVRGVPGHPEHTFTVRVWDRDTYLVSDSTDTERKTPVVTRKNGTWRCSEHPNASEDNPCTEILLVLGLTDGGKNPPMEAEVVIGERDAELESRKEDDRK